MSKVYILTDGGHDYSGAKDFGDLVFCLPDVIKKSDVAQMYRELSVALEDYQVDDYLLVSGLTTLCMVASAMIAHRFEEVRFLIFDKGQYTAKQLFLQDSP